MQGLEIQLIIGLDWHETHRGSAQGLSNRLGGGIRSRDRRQSEVNPYLPAPDAHRFEPARVQGLSHLFRQED
jgi:hypothetical protein